MLQSYSSQKKMRLTDRSPSFVGHCRLILLSEFQRTLSFWQLVKLWCENPITRQPATLIRTGPAKTFRTNANAASPNKSKPVESFEVKANVHDTGSFLFTPPHGSAKCLDCCSGILLPMTCFSCLGSLKLWKRSKAIPSLQTMFKLTCW